MACVGILEDLHDVQCKILISSLICLITGYYRIIPTSYLNPLLANKKYYDDGICWSSEVLHDKQESGRSLTESQHANV